MKVLSPSRMIFVALMMLASIGRTADAQLIQGALDFFTTFDFDAFFASICPSIGPLFESFGVTVPFCDVGGTDDETDDGTDDGTDDEPAPSSPVAAPTKKGKVVASTAAPVAPSATP